MRTLVEVRPWILSDDCWSACSDPRESVNVCICSGERSEPLGPLLLGIGRKHEPWRAFSGARQPPEPCARGKVDTEDEVVPHSTLLDRHNCATGNRGAVLLAVVVLETEDPADYGEVAASTTYSAGEPGPMGRAHGRATHCFFQKRRPRLTTLPSSYSRYSGPAQEALDIRSDTRWAPRSMLAAIRATQGTWSRSRGGPDAEC